MRAAQQTAREQIRETAKNEHIAAVHKAKENVQALKREARKYGYRFARAKAQLEKLRPKVDQLHAHVNAWLEASTTASGEFWRNAADAHKASTKGANEYHHVAGKRVPLIEAKSMRARDFRKLQQEKFAHKDKRSRRPEVAESAISTPGISRSPNAVVAELADGLRKRKREDENEDSESDAKRMRTTAYE
ncbi:uncharacterized protein RHO25_008672 [Cercospora beticola]|uniref:Uncharacterized protein n=1 Tax=Cercospora beticola TaxID=122368 RepID=A0ABZ0NWP8_CERBT|nr:hypothetical protein RHO25_008672 [Cercospora beticola]